MVEAMLAVPLASGLQKEGELLYYPDPDGWIPGGSANAFGLYFLDSRHLSCLDLAVDGNRAEAAGSLLSAGSAVMHWETVVTAGRLFGRLRVNSVARADELCLTLQGDFRDVFEVRGVYTADRRRAGAARWLGAACLFRRQGADGLVRRTLVRFSPSPDRWEVDGTRVRAFYRLDGPRLVDLSVQPEVGERSREGATARRLDFPEAMAVRRRHEAAWDGACTAVHCSDDALSRVFAHARRDLGDLWSGGEDGILHAGAPWFAAPFGRDALIAAWAALPLNPDLAKGTLRFLARYQGQRSDPTTEEEPGKILHELRRGELAGAHLVPHHPYYGSVDATPLWAALLGEASRWWQSTDLAAELAINLGAALAWCAGPADPDADGLIEYRGRRTAWGLVHEGWKDSWDGVIRPDGTIPKGPIALVEVQGYHYGALVAASGLYTALGRSAEASAARRAASSLAHRFHAAFWSGPGGVPAMALDGRKRPVRTAASNFGHLLATGPLTAVQARVVVERLLQPDFLSGWGVRTLAASEGPYDPGSYHNGSVWPHDTAMIAFGLRRRGAADAAARVADQLFDALRAFPGGRIPELFSGAPRVGADPPLTYPNACAMQAWSSAGVYLLLRTVLGLTPTGRGLAIVAPRLPQGVEELTLSRLRFGTTRATLRFVRRSAPGRIDCEVLEVDGPGEVSVRPDVR